MVLDLIREYVGRRAGVEPGEDTLNLLDLDPKALDLVKNQNKLKLPQRR